MRILVTGGAGFIGSHVLDALRAAGHEAVIFDLVPSRHHAAGTYETILGDLTRPEVVRRAVGGCDAVIHLAAIADVNDVVANPVLADRVNVHGTQMILEAARHEAVERMIYASTIWVYGDSLAATPDENSPLAQPRHLYTATKLAGENYVASYNSQFGGRHTILRLGIPYGPLARPAAVVPSFIDRAQRGEALQIAGDGRQTRQFVYVVDLADAIVTALAPQAARRIYNVVGEEATSVREIADAVRSLVAPVPIVHGPERHADVHLGQVSGARMAAELNWTPRTTFREGLRLYLDWLTETSASPVADAAASTAGSAAAVFSHESPEP